MKLAENHELLSDSVIYSCLITYEDHLIARQIKQEGLFILGSEDLDQENFRDHLCTAI